MTTTIAESERLALEQRATRVLQKLITHRGIFASEDNGWQGAFHSWFGRDSAITAALIFDAEVAGATAHLSKKAYHGLANLRHWQGEHNEPTTGEERGKITHEVRSSTSRNPQTLLRLKRFRALWYASPTDKFLKNWDSVDSTPLWIITVSRYHQISGQPYRPEIITSLRGGLEWCLANLQQFDGLAGFIGSDLIPERGDGGFHNQGWKDNYGAYQYADGTIARQPIKDVLVNGLFWAALNYGAGTFAVRDAEFAQRLRLAAQQLKKRFNTKAHGFLMTDSTTGYYFAEAIDGSGKRLQNIAADAAMCLWAYYNDECIIDTQYIPAVVKRIMQTDMFNPKAGVRNYSNKSFSKLYFNGYHRGPETYWPFVSGLVADGLDHFGFTQESDKVACALLRGVSNFDSCIELFIGADVPRQFVAWHHPTEKQESAINQAWTAAAMYYATARLAERSKIR